jgi:hypothetical protein
VSRGLLLLLSAFLSAAVAFVVALRGSKLGWLPTATNYRGRLLPVVLGIAVTSGVVVGSLAVLMGDLRRARILPTIEGTLQILVAIVMVFIAGLFDDRHPHLARGLMAHARALARGTLTSGILKLVAIVVASTVVIEATRGISLDSAVGIAFIAGTANLWNQLDVAPGRAIKFYLLAAVAVLGATALMGLCVPCGFSVFVITGLAAALVALPFDLREWAMLGDGGSNVLGFLVGAGLFLRLSTGWLWIGLGVVLVLTLLAETVTLSRFITAAPLRWFDDFGRIRPVSPASVLGENPRLPEG